MQRESGLTHVITLVSNENPPGHPRAHDLPGGNLCKFRVCCFPFPLWQKTIIKEL